MVVKFVIACFILNIIAAYLELYLLGELFPLFSAGFFGRSILCSIGSIYIVRLIDKRVKS